MRCFLKKIIVLFVIFNPLLLFLPTVYFMVWIRFTTFHLSQVNSLYQSVNDVDRPPHLTARPSDLPQDAVVECLKLHSCCNYVIIFLQCFNSIVRISLLITLSVQCRDEVFYPGVLQGFCSAFLSPFNFKVLNVPELLSFTYSFTNVICNFCLWWLFLSIFSVQRWVCLYADLNTEALRHVQSIALCLWAIQQVNVWLSPMTRGAGLIIMLTVHF